MQTRDKKETFFQFHIERTWFEAVGWFVQRIWSFCWAKASHSSYSRRFFQNGADGVKSEKTENTMCYAVIVGFLRIHHLQLAIAYLHSPSFESIQERRLLEQKWPVNRQRSYPRRADGWTHVKNRNSHQKVEIDTWGEEKTLTCQCHDDGFLCAGSTFALKNGEFWRLRGCIIYKYKVKNEDIEKAIDIFSSYPSYLLADIATAGLYKRELLALKEYLDWDKKE